MKTSRDPRGVWAALSGGLFLLAYALAGPTAAAGPQCVDFSKDPAGCQPSTFDTPMAQMPSVRVNRQGGRGSDRLRRRTREPAPPSSKRICTCSGTSSICTGC